MTSASLKKAPQVPASGAFPGRQDSSCPSRAVPSPAQRGRRHGSRAGRQAGHPAPAMHTRSSVRYTRRYRRCSFGCTTKPRKLFLDPAANGRSPNHPPHNLSKVRHILIQVFVVKRFHDRLLQKENSDNLVAVGQWI